MNESISVACPYCGEKVVVEPEPCDGPVEYVEDCAVCCRPITFMILFSEEGSTVTAQREDA